MNTIDQSCRFCSGPLEHVDDMAGFYAVTSDCRPFRRGSVIAICTACGGVQKPVTPQWTTDVSDIYRDYALYAQSTTGQEQMSFDRNGNASPRTALALNSIVDATALPVNGTFLDVGAGNGALLRAAGNALPQWRRFAYEPNVRERERLMQAQVERIYEGTLAELGGSFDAIGFFHVLEHVADIDEFLGHIRRLCGPRSHVFMQVPYHVVNPFDLLIADHCNHFSEATFSRVLDRLGLSVTRLDTAVVSGNITAVSVPSQPSRSVLVDDNAAYATARTALDRSVTWLQRTLARAKDVAASSETFGIFGISIGGTWLSSELAGHVDFFVDEDPSRVNRNRFGLPVRAPEDVPPNTDVYVALTGDSGRLVADRLARRSVRFHFLEEAVVG